MVQVYPSVHPLVHAKVTSLRALRTRPSEFRQLVRSLAVLLAQEATGDLATRPVEVTTPMGASAGFELAERIAIVPILRAGLGMVEGVLELFPDAEVWHVGLYRDEKSLVPVEYYRKVPQREGPSIALIVDPMLATGGSAVRACEILKAAGVRRIKLVSLIAASEGIAKMGEYMPDVPIHVGAVDSHLNEIGFIVPGLGDAGDRQFNTSVL